MMTPIHHLLDHEDGTEPHHRGAVCVWAETIYMPGAGMWTREEAEACADDVDPWDGDFTDAAVEARQALCVFAAMDDGRKEVDLDVEADLEWERRCAVSDRRHGCPASAVAWRV